MSNWKRDISNYPRLSLKEVKEIINEINSTDNKVLKKQKRDYLICGTLYVIYDIISKDFFDIINNSVYDLEDIMNSCVEIWIEMIDDGTVLKAKNYSSLFQLKFYSKLSKKILQSENLSICEHFKLLSLKNFHSIFSIYLEMRQQKDAISVSDFILKLGESSDKKAIELYEEIFIRCNYYNGAYREDCLKIVQNILFLFDNIYGSMDLKEDDILVLPKTTIEYLKILFVNNGFDYSCKDVSEVETEDFSDDLIDWVYNNEVYSCVFEKSNLSPREQKIIFERYYELKTLDEVAQMFNRSPETIRRIEAKSIRKLEIKKEIKSLKC